ncbi:DUF2523 domain-containing protein [Nitrosomonas sp.]|uniref:DUF2523 domain-containing protein n=1 Tax=Nitrosomonas sp. TaxID=42353 RepID=UPI0025F6D304|nr:DUF2523 domain-containing protein [Nitrosomonas sp.]MBV6446696.1 hypothetical protein [Nitrosomonas sp.]MBV6446707.1 hypothetical protein [Nitrosomonas sp.]
MNILIPLGAFLSGALGSFAVRAAIGLGLGFISYTTVMDVLVYLIIMAQLKYNAIPSFAINLIGLSGFGDALGMITGAITFRASFIFMTKIGVLPK